MQRTALLLLWSALATPGCLAPSAGDFPDGPGGKLDAASAEEGEAPLPPEISALTARSQRTAENGLAIADARMALTTCDFNVSSTVCRWMLAALRPGDSPSEVLTADDLAYLVVFDGYHHVVPTRPVADRVKAFATGAAPTFATMVRAIPGRSSGSQVTAALLERLGALGSLSIRMTSYAQAPPDVEREVYGENKELRFSLRSLLQKSSEPCEVYVGLLGAVLVDSVTALLLRTNDDAMSTARGESATTERQNSAWPPPATEREESPYLYPELLIYATGPGSRLAEGYDGLDGEGRLDWGALGFELASGAACTSLPPDLRADQ